MSQIDDEMVLSETRVEQGDSLKLVPVAESIRYRRRAQSAEKRAEELAEQLNESKLRCTKMAEQLSNIQTEQKLMRKLTSAGTVDLEAAVLIAKTRVEELDDTDLDSVVEQLKKEKQYLFGGQRNVASTAQKTAGVKDKIQNSQTVLEKAASKAARTGHRTDLQEYLKLRRNFI